jgi:hypothetical protein
MLASGSNFPGINDGEKIVDFSIRTPARRERLMEHRRFLAHPEAHRPFVGGGLLRRIGGRTTVEALIDGLYDRIETDPMLGLPFGRDLANEREAQKRFFTEWARR